MIKFAVISFPGTNCEAENVRVFKRNGMDAEMVLWNDPGILDGSRLDEFDGYCIAGGFSFEDRGRSGIVSAQEPITEILKEEADNGKIVMGICNGAQILVETGLVPGFDNKTLGMALTWNEMKKGGEIIGTGYYNVWCRLKNTAKKNRSAFNDFDELLHIPIAHGEGRFVVDDATLKTLEEYDQILFKYVDESGNVNPDFPHTPNGATASIAAVCSPKGNVMAIMPHPERDPKGNGNAIFASIKRWIEAGKKSEHAPLGKEAPKEDIRPLSSYDIEVFLKLIITDNAERTIEEALVRKDIPVKLTRFEYFGISLEEGADPKKTIEKIMNTGELANFNKHLAYVKIDGKTFAFQPGQGLTEKDLPLDDFAVVFDHKDFIGEQKKAAINLHAGGIVSDLHYGVLWDFNDTDEATVTDAIDSKVLYNPYSMYLMKS